MIEEVKVFTEELVKSLCTEPDLVKVKDFEDEEGFPILEVMVSESDIGKVIGKNGKTIKALRTLIQVTAFNKGVKRVKINVDSF